MVLWPDKDPEFCHVPGDEGALHFGVFIESMLVCVASVYPSKKNARLRKFATLKEFQGRGIGTKLLNYIFESLNENRNIKFWCDARESAVEFYERFGMSKEGGKFYKYNIPYYKMSKMI